MRGKWLHVDMIRTESRRICAEDGPKITIKIILSASKNDCALNSPSIFAFSPETSKALKCRPYFTLGIDRGMPMPKDVLSEDMEMADIDLHVKQTG